MVFFVLYNTERKSFHEFLENVTFLAFSQLNKPVVVLQDTDIVDGEASLHTHFNYILAG